MNTRSYPDPESTRKGAPVAASEDSVALPLPGQPALLIHQSLNAVLHGIRGIDFFSQVGIGKPALAETFDSLDEWLRVQETNETGLPIARFDRPFSLGEIRALRNALELAMLDLGQEEFFTRTGFTLAEAADLLHRFNAALLNPLHIDSSAQPVA